MEKILIFVSTERNNIFFNNELEKAVNFLKKKSPQHPCDLQHVRLVSVIVSGSEEEDSSNDGVTHTEWMDWRNDNEALSKAIQYNLEEDNEEDDNEEHNKFRYNDIYVIAEALHKVADSNQELGSFLLQVIWCVDNYAPNPSEVPEFYGALRRLQLWHGGGLSIVCQDEEVTNEWPPFLPVQVTQKSDQIVSDTVDSMWRGNLMVCEDNGDSQIFSECVISCISGHPLLMADSKQDPLYLLPKVEVVCDFDTGTLPWMHVKQGSVYSLTPAPCSDPEEQEEASQLLNLLTQRPGSGTLIRLRYSPLPPTMEGVKALTAVEWKKCYADGNFDTFPSLSFKGHHLILNMVLLSEGAVPGKGLLVALQDPSACGEDVFKLLKNNTSNINEDDEKKVLSLLKETPCLTSLHMAALSHLALNLPKQIKRRVESRGAGKELDPEMKAQLEAEASKQLLQSLLQMPAPPYKLPTQTHTILPETCVSSSSQWAEYIALMEAEQEAERTLNKQRNAGGFLGGLAPPPPPENVVPLEAAQLIKLFKKSGEATEKIRKKMTAKLPSAKQFNLRGRATLEEIKVTPWSDALYSRHHGLYFNVDDHSEHLEENCLQLQAQFIRRETASTCTVFQDKEQAYITVNSNQTANNNPPDQTRGKSKADDKHRRSITAKLVSSASDVDSASVNSGTNSSRQLNVRRKSPRKSQIQPEKGKRSPRKSGRRDSEELKPSSLLQPAPSTKETRSGSGGGSKTGASNKNPTPANLSDAHKAKLRNAIVEALDTEGMNLKDPLFKVCFKKLFAVSLPFIKDLVGITKGSTSKAMEKITKSHVKQVIEFEKLKNKKR